MKQSAADIINRIYREAKLLRMKQFPLGLLEGDMGRLLFLTEYACYREDDKKLRAIYHTILHSFSKLESFAENRTYSGGLLGYLMFLDYFTKRTGFDTEIDEETAAFLECHICSYLERDLHQRDNYDFMIGAIAAGFYLLAKNPESPFINILVNYFGRKKTETASGISWLEPKGIFPNRNRDNTVNLGMAHGILPVILFLAKCSSAGIHQETTTGLVRESLRFIHNSRMPDSTGAYRYPAFIVNGVKKTSRHGWCYGDLPIASLLLQCGMLLNDAALVNEAQEVVIHSCMLRSSRQAHIEDASICHGSAGLYLQYQVMASHFNDPLIAETAAYWKAKTTWFSRHANGIGGYLTPTRVGLQKNPGLLGGAVGTGLCLLFSENGQHAPWLHFLLLPEKKNDYATTNKTAQRYAEAARN